MATRKPAPSKPTKGRPGRKKGTPKTGGRQKGTPNKVTSAAREAATELVDDPIYRAKLLKDIRARKVHSAIEAMFWHYSKGKPKESLELSGAIGLQSAVEAATARAYAMDPEQLRKEIALEEEYLQKLAAIRGE